LDGHFECRYRFEKLGSVEQLLIGHSILDHDLGLAIDRQDQWGARFLETVDELRGSATEVAQGVGFDATLHARGLLRQG
jgi:hypothetical protein